MRVDLFASLPHTIRLRRLLATGIVCAIDLAGCAATRKAPDVFWPDPPDKPRIKYLRSLQSKDDVGGLSIREMLVGIDKTLALYQPMGLALSADRQRLYVAHVDRQRSWVYGSRDVLPEVRRKE